MEGMEPEDMISKSFKQFQYEIQSKKDIQLYERWVQTLKFLESNYLSLNLERVQKLQLISDLTDKLKDIYEQINEVLVTPQVILPYMNIGRLFFIEGCGWCPLVNISKQKGEVVLDVFLTLNFSNKKDLREKVKCNCQNCVRKY